MDELFSCRNCVQNCAQSLSIGPGLGFCLHFRSIIEEPANTTCKYLHRKDLPAFVVDEGTREHAAEFTFFGGMATLDAQEPVGAKSYSERVAWEMGTFDPVTHALAQYHKTPKSWVFVQSLSGGVDGRRSLAHASAVRRYMAHCGSWQSSYRLVLGLLQEIDITPHFAPRDLLTREHGEDGAKEDALWDVVFSRLSLIQEYGWHAGIEEITWISDRVNGSLTDFDWSKLSEDLTSIRDGLTRQIIDHAKKERVFFPWRGTDEADRDWDEEP